MNPSPQSQALKESLGLRLMNLLNFVYQTVGIGAWPEMLTKSVVKPFKSIRVSPKV